MSYCVKTEKHNLVTVGSNKNMFTDVQYKINYGKETD